jgi:hypothetical protein
MSFFYGKSEPEKIGLNVLPDTGEEIGFVEAIPKAYKAQVRGKNTDTYEYLLSEQMEPILDIIKERSGEEFINPGSYIGATDTMGHNERARNNTINKILKHIKKSPDLYPEYQDLSPEIIDRRIKDIAKTEIDASEKDREKLTTAGVIGDFIGGTGGVFVDQNFFELNLLTLGINAPAQTLSRTLFRDAVVGAGTEAILQTGVKEWYDEIGVEYGWADFVGNVSMAGVGSAVLPQALRYGGKGIKAGVSLTNDQLRKGLTALRDAGYIDKKDADIIGDMVDDADILAERPPSFVGDDAAQELKSKIKAAIEASKQPGAEKIPQPEPVVLGEEPQIVGPTAGPRPDFTVDPKGRAFPDVLKPIRAKEKKPKTLLQFIREEGGITPNDRNVGDVKQYLDKSVFTVLNKKTGKHLDDIAVAAQEAGYFPSRMDAYNDRITVNDLLDAIAEDVQTKSVFSLYDDVAVANLEKAQSLYDEAMAIGINPVGLTDDQFMAALAERRSLQEIADRIPQGIREGMTEDEMYAEMQIFDPEVHMARAEKATADLYAGRLPEVEGNPPIDMPAPKVPDVDTTSIDALVDNFKAVSDDIADDDVLYFDNDAGDPIEFSGAQIKQDIAQDDTMLDRLKGCVIR